MKPIHLMGVTCMTVLLGTTALAQGGPGPGPAAGAPAAAMDSGKGRAPAARWGADFTPGWSLMTRAERSEHQERLRSMQTYEECKAYMEQHQAQMAARAQEKGRKALAQPRRDACAALKP